jgi:Tfp pilus assembly protein PilF
MTLAVLFLVFTVAPAAQAPPPETSATLQKESSAGTTASAQPYIDAGVAAFKRRRFAKAEVDFRKAVEADPGSAAAHFYLAYTKYKMVEKKKPFHPGKQEAAAEFARAYELDPTFQPIWHMKR